MLTPCKIVEVTSAGISIVHGRILGGLHLWQPCMPCIWQDIGRLTPLATMYVLHMAGYWAAYTFGNHLCLLYMAGYWAAYTFGNHVCLAYGRILGGLHLWQPCMSCIWQDIGRLTPLATIYVCCIWQDIGRLTPLATMYALHMAGYWAAYTFGNHVCLAYGRILGGLHLWQPSMSVVYGRILGGLHLWQPSMSVVYGRILGG